MEYKEILGLIAVVLALACYLPYYWGIFRGTIRLHIYTYLIWSLITVIAFGASWFSGGAAGSWSLGVSGILVIGVFFLCFRYGTGDVTTFDKVCLALAVLSIFPWIITKDPTLSVVLVTLIEVFAFFPTFRKTWHEPDTESATSWGINTVKHAIAIAALGSFSAATVLYPAVLVVMNGLLAGEIILRRNQLARSK